MARTGSDWRWRPAYERQEHRTIALVLPVASMTISSSGLSFLANRNSDYIEIDLPGISEFSIFQNGRLGE